MRRSLVLWMVVGVSSVLVCVVNADAPVDFEDSNLKEAVKQTLGITHDPTQSEMLSLTFLSAETNGIVSLAGLEYATNLQSLWLRDNQISDISALANLTSLSTLVLGGNHISDISALANLTSLSYLDLGRNQISDISPLANLTSLSSMDLHTNQISSISPLANLTSLGQLNLLDNQISDISPLANLTSLSWLYLKENPLDAAAYTTYIPQIHVNNPGITLLYDPPTWRMLTLSSGVGGRVIDPGEGSFSYIDGQSVTILAAADPGYDFSHWSGSLWSTGNPMLLTMDMDYTIQANFAVHRHVLTIAERMGGSVLTPGEGRFEVAYGTILAIEAVPSDADHEFSRWSGTAVDSGKVQDPNAATTTVLVDADYTLQAVFAGRSTPAFGFTLGDLGMDNPQQFESRVSTNNTPGAAQVERVTGQMPDPNGMMAMHVVDGSAAEAKGRFGRTTEGRVWIEFKYLFESPDVEMEVYLSDRPDLGDRDPNHVKEVARLVPPAEGRPGSVGSGRFGQFEQWVDATGLDLSQGTWVELELVQKAKAQAMRVYSLRLAAAGSASTGGSGGSIKVDDWSVRVYCSGICMDVSGDDLADGEDFMLVMASTGGRVGSGPASLYCCEGLFSRDGYIDGLDLCSWDWALRNLSRLGNLCGVPLSRCPTCGAIMTLSSSMSEDSGASWTGLPQGYTGVVVLGKRIGTGAALKDSLYLFDGSGQYKGSLSAGAGRCNVRVVQGQDSQIYLINSETGVWRLEQDGSMQCIVPAGIGQWASDPRYHSAATISIGIQQQGQDTAGRPILDAVIVGGSVYVVPVVVSPEGGDPYVAAARLDLRPGQDPPYQVAQVYDDPGLVNKDLLDNPNLSGLRELEVDGAGNVYILNAHSHNESDVLWRYGADGTVQRLLLGNPKGAVYLPDPIGLCVGSEPNRVYLASGQADPHDPNGAQVYRFSAGDLSLQRTVALKGMQHVTGMTMEPKTGVLWVVGFGVGGSAAPTCEPYLAQVPAQGAQPVQAIPLSGTDMTKDSDLAVPMSIVWTGN